MNYVNQQHLFTDPRSALLLIHTEVVLRWWDVKGESKVTGLSHQRHGVRSVNASMCCSGENGQTMYFVI